MYLQRVNEISPNIRYCAYNIGDESAINDLMEMRLKSGQEDGLTNRLDVRLQPLSVSPMSLSFLSASVSPTLFHSPLLLPLPLSFPCLSIPRPLSTVFPHSISILISLLCGPLSSPSITILCHLDESSSYVKPPAFLHSSVFLIHLSVFYSYLSYSLPLVVPCSLFLPSLGLCQYIT